MYIRKAAIITINDLSNYGNRLQNYAVQQCLKKLNVYSENVVDETRFSEMIIKPHSIKLYIKKSIVILNSIVSIKCLKSNVINWNNEIKENNFYLFNKGIKYSGLKIKNDEHIKEYRNEDIYIVGSDQVWNPNFAISPVTLLENVHSKNKVAFAASFGVNTFPYNQRIANCINDFKAISVREENGARIIKDLTGRNATVLVDPTMLLTDVEWRKVSKKPKGIKKQNYILTYFLSPKCKKAEEELFEVCKSRVVYELMNQEDMIAGVAGPSEFLWLFDHADLILTDSFHACIFSFLFNKPFIVYDRNWEQGNMNSRLETFLSKFKLERKYANSGLDNRVWEHDYKEGYRQLELERNKALKFLEDVLDL